VSDAAGRKWWHVALALACAGWWLRKLVVNPGNQWDFSVYYYSAQAWRAGLDPYDTASLPLSLASDGFKYNYPPHALGLFAPLTFVTLHQAMLLYLALKLVAFGFLVRIWSRILRVDVVDPAWVLFLLLAYSSAIFIDFVSGNVTTFEQLVLWIGVTALLQERYWPYVVAVVAASLLRLTLLPLLLACLVAPGRRGYVYVAGGAAAFLSIFLVTYLIAPHLTIGFFQSVPKNVGEAGRLNPSLMPLVQDLGVLARTVYGALLKPALEVALYVVLAATIVVPTIVLAKRIADTNAVNRIEVIVYCAFLAYALTMPRFKNYSYMLLIVPTYYIAVRSKHLRPALPLLLIACLPVYSWLTRPEQISLVANYSQWLIALGAWGLFIYELRSGGLLVDAAVASVRRQQGDTVFAYEARRAREDSGTRW
jgi:hypothetical protein